MKQVFCENPFVCMCLFIKINKYKNIYSQLGEYLFIFIYVSGLACSVRALELGCAGLAALRRLGSWFPDPGSSPSLRRWELDFNPQTTSAVPVYAFLVSLWGEMSSGSSWSSTLLEKRLTVVLVPVISRGEPVRAPASPAAGKLRPGASGSVPAQGCVSG